MKDVLEGLNDQQKEAVTTTKGPVLMLAGAGSGKTKALTHRLAYLVLECKVDPTNILAVTFTNKAAGEMRRRVARLLSYNEDNTQYMPFLGTFHSIANKILRREASHIGYSSSFLIYDTADSHAVIKSIIKKLKLDEKQVTTNAIANIISSAKNELIGASEYRQLASGKMQEIAADIYPLYQRELQNAQAMDFDDLIMKLVMLLSENKEVLEYYQKKFKYILVDEYQDTNQAQYKLISMLASVHQNICVVGDDWQSIYSWRGANYQNILNFEKDYPDAKIIKLERNYRSTQIILDAAGAVISKNTSRSNKKLWTSSEAGEPLRVVHVRDELEEGRYIIQTIQSLLQKDPRLSLADFAVLYRTNAQSRSLEEAFLRYGVAYQIIGGVRFYDRKEIKDVLAYLRFVFQPGDQVSLNRIINLPPRGLGQKSLQLFFDYCARKETPLLVAMANASSITGLSAKAVSNLIEFGETITHIAEQSQTLPINDLIELVLNRSGYLDFLDDGSISSAERVENVRELLSVAKSYASFSLQDFLAEISLISDVDSLREASGAVTLMTLHSAKGLEFDTVFIAGVEEGVLPHSRTFFEASELEEERRLCYVGMTRAKARLYLMVAGMRLLYGNSTHNLPSRFIAEIPAELVENNGATDTTAIDISQQNRDNQNSEPFEDMPDIKPGDKVSHEVFGEGTILSLHDEEIEIHFTKVGIKKLNIYFAHLSKA